VTVCEDAGFIDIGFYNFPFQICNGLDDVFFHATDGPIVVEGDIDEVGVIFSFFFGEGECFGG